MLTKALNYTGLRGWHLHVGALGAIYLCIALWIRAKTVDQEERGNAERRAQFAPGSLGAAYRPYADKPRARIARLPKANRETSRVRSRLPRDGDHARIKRRGDPPELLSVQGATRLGEPTATGHTQLTRRTKTGVPRPFRRRLRRSRCG